MALSLSGMRQVMLAIDFNNADTFDLNRCRSIEENNALLEEKFPDVPLCCGRDGILDVDKNTCSNSQELPQAMTACNWRNKQSLLVSRLDVDEEDKVVNSTNFICIGSLSKERTFLGAVTCKVTP